MLTISQASGKQPTIIMLGHLMTIYWSEDMDDSPEAWTSKSKSAVEAPIRKGLLYWKKLF